MKNRKLLLIVSLVLALTMSLGGTLAYLQDSDADVNTMVLGNVTITQNEQEWNADKTELVSFTQDKPMLPVVGDAAYNEYGDNPEIRRLTMANVVDKYVSVTNTGKSDAYVRTLIALEMGSVKFEDLGNILMANINKADGQEFDFPGTWLWPIDDVFTIDGQQYNVMVAVHENPVKPGETTIPSLLQVYLKSNANNQDLIDLDGNENGKYDVLVLSQAIQADGFADAATALNAGFGEVNETNVAEWFKKDNLVVGTPGDKWPSNDVPSDELTVVSTVEELAEALNNNENVILKNDFDNVPVDTTAPYGNKYGIKQDGQTIDGNNKTILFESYGDNYGIMTSGGIIKNVVLKDVARGIVTMNEKEDLVLENVTVTDGVLYPFNTAELGTAAGLELIVNDSKFGGWFSFNGGFEKATFTDCAFVMGNYGYGWPYECLVRPFINTMFDGCDFAETYYLDLSALEDGCKVTLKDCTVNGTKITSDLCGFNCDGTETFCIELPSGRTLADCVIFE